MDGLHIEGNPLFGKFSTACLTSVTSRSSTCTSGSSRERLYSTGKWHLILSKSLWKRMPSTSFCKGSDTIAFFYLLLYEPSLSKSGLFVVDQHRKQWESLMLPCTYRTTFPLWIIRGNGHSWRQEMLLVAMTFMRHLCHVCLPQLYAKLMSGNNPYSDLIGIYSWCSSIELIFFQCLCVRFLSATEANNVG